MAPERKRCEKHDHADRRGLTHQIFVEKSTAQPTTVRHGRQVRPNEHERDTHHQQDEETPGQKPENSVDVAICDQKACDQRIGDKPDHAPSGNLRRYRPSNRHRRPDHHEEQGDVPEQESRDGMKADQDEKRCQSEAREKKQTKTAPRSFIERRRVSQSEQRKNRAAGYDQPKQDEAIDDPEQNRLEPAGRFALCHHRHAIVPKPQPTCGRRSIDLQSARSALALI